MRKFKVKLTGGTDEAVEAATFGEEGHEGRWFVFYAQATGTMAKHGQPIRVFRSADIVEISVEQ